MAPSHLKEIQIGQFTVQGTNSLLLANKAIQRLLRSNRCGLKAGKYTISGKTITYKPRTTT